MKRARYALFRYSGNAYTTIIDSKPAIVKQIIQPKEIWILQDKNHIDISSTVKKYREIFPDIHLVHSAIKLKYFWRFTLCIYVKTNYALIIDDGVIPSFTWLETCLLKSQDYNALVSCTGRIIKPYST